MPLGDGTGPRGLGPMTGRAAGYCAGYPVPGYMNPIPGFGYGRGGTYFGSPVPIYGTIPYGMYGMSGYPGYYPVTALPWGRGRGRFYGYFPRFGRSFGRGRGRW